MTGSVSALDVVQPVQDGLTTVTTFIPKLIGALLILLLGYIVARVVATIVNKVLERFHFDDAVEKGPVKKALSGSEYDASDIVAKVVFYAIFIPFLSAAVGALGIQALQAPLAAFILLLPKILVAIVLVVLGGVVAGAVKRLVESSLGGLSYGGFLADGVAVLVLLGFLKAALDQVGIATSVTGPVLIALLATIGGILIVGVGGALIKPMQSRMEGLLDRASDEADKVTDEASNGNGSSRSEPRRRRPLPTV